MNGFVTFLRSFLVVCCFLLPSASNANSAHDVSRFTSPESFVVWESNRAGNWRIWIRSLKGEPAQQLTEDTSRRQHCCPHLSPNGRFLVYLSLPSGQENYPEDGALGSLIWLDLKTDETQTISDARTYFEHRAAVWKNDQELIFIDAKKRSVLFDLQTQNKKILFQNAGGKRGWLIDPTLHHATHGSPSFSTYDASTRSVQSSKNLGGCQPYFSPDGRWGYWIAAAGGPLYRMRLDKTRSGDRHKESIWLEKNDPLLHAGQGYFYFPMLSQDQTLLVLGASQGKHDHARSNYDLFILPVDPKTLQPLALAHRLTDHPATDRYPDIHAAPFTLQDRPRPRLVGSAAPSVLLSWSANDESSLSHFLPEGQVSFAQDGSMEFEGGYFLADMETMETLLHGARAKNVLSIELWLTSDESQRQPRSTILTFSGGERRRNLTLAQEGRTLLFRLRTPTSGEDADRPEIVLGDLPSGRHHIVISYRPGLLSYFLNGEKRLESRELQSGFFHWKARPLLLGNAWQSARPWQGKIHAFGLYSHFIDAEEAHRRFASKFED